MPQEIWDLLDSEGRLTGKTMVRGQEVPPGMYHIGVHIWPMDGRGRLLVQKRSMQVLWKPGIWAATGGSALSGETPEEAARRELREELGYEAQADELKLLARLRRTNSFCSIFFLITDRPAEAFRLQKEEVSEVRWFTQEQIRRMLRTGQMYNYGDPYYRMLFDMQQKYRKH